MKQDMKDAIYNVASRVIGFEEFKNEFLSLTENLSEFILSGINQAIEEKNAEELELFLLLIPHDENYKSTDLYVAILSQLLLENWHVEHEYIVLMLQKLKSPKSVKALYQACLSKPDYMAYDDSYSLARKCIHALADINTLEAIEKLRLLTQSNIQIISEKAQKQLSKLK